MSNQTLSTAVTIVPISGTNTDVAAPSPSSPKRAIDADRELIKEIAMDIGKAVIEHIEIAYPAALAAVAGIAKLSIRNTVYNEIMAALEFNDVDAIRARLERRKSQRRDRLKAWRGIRKSASS